MATQSPFSFLDGLFERVMSGPLVHEVQHRTVLFLNHVLMQEREAMDRLARQRGRVARVQWRIFSMALQVTPAGLFDLAPAEAVADLRLEVSETSPLRGDKPTIRIEGDVQFAAEINWLVDHVRWDVEEDMARVIGDAPARAVASVVGRAVQALRSFVGARVPGGQAPAPAAGELPDRSPP